MTVDLVVGTLALAEGVVGAFVDGVPWEVVPGFFPLAPIALAGREGGVGAPVEVVPPLCAALLARVVVAVNRTSDRTGGER